MELKGTIKKITVHKDASSNTVQRIVLDVFGNVLPANSLLDTPLKITLEAE